MAKPRIDEDKLLAKFNLTEIGQRARITHKSADRFPLFVADVQNLIISSQGLYPGPDRWCVLKLFDTYSNSPKFNPAAVIVVENVSMYDYYSNESMFSFLKTLKHKFELFNPSIYKSDFIKNFSIMPIPKNITRSSEQNQYITKTDGTFDEILNLFPIDYSISTSSALPPSDIIPRTHLILSGWQLIEESFPLPLKTCEVYKDFKLTKNKYKPVTPNSPMFAIDCEMCETVRGLELTRVSIIDEKHNVCYNSLVKPYNKILNYLTKFSGITAKMLQNVSKRLEEVQQEICNLLPDDAILVGHSLFNDLRHIRLIHPYCIDTSVIYNTDGRRHKKPKLSTLAMEYLKERIQMKRTGHCSIEDSLASMKLVQLKLRKSFLYGDKALCGRFVYNESNCALNIFGLLTKRNKTVTIVGEDEVCQEYQSLIRSEDSDKSLSFLKKETNEDIVEKMMKPLDDHHVIVGHIHIENEDFNEDNKTKTIKYIDESIQKIYQRLKYSGLLCVIFSSSENKGNGVCFVQIKNE